MGGPYRGIMRLRRFWRSRSGLLVLTTGALFVAVLAAGWQPHQPPPCSHEGGPPVAADPEPAGASSSSEFRGPVGWEAFRRLDDLPMLSVGSQPRMFSSADPAGGNADGFSGTYLCRDGDDYVLGEHTGPGELTSLWFTRGDGYVGGNGRLRIELDGRTVVDAPLQDVVDGGLGPPFVHPLVGNADQSSGGTYIQVPMPFRESMRVTTTRRPRFYRVQYRVFGNAGGIRTFDRSDPARDVVESLRAAGSGDPKPPHPDTRRTRRALRLAPGQTSPPLRLSGPGVVSALRLRLPQVPVLPQLGDGERQAGSTEMSLAIDPANDGVRIVRRTPSRGTAQIASVLVDGDLTRRPFSEPREQPDGRFEERVDLPGSLTAGRDELRLAAVEPGPGSLEVQSFVRGQWEVTDRRLLPAPPAVRTIDPGEAGRLLRRLRLRISFDGRRTVDAPVGEFFGAGLGKRPVATLLFAVDREQGFRAWWPMPFARDAVVQLHNGSDRSVTAGDLEVAWRPESRWRDALGPEGSAGYFHATSRQGPVTPGEDWELLDEAGHGRVVGLAQTMRGDEPGRLYLEGDERVRIDGARSPQLHGTGTEDLYLAGWYYNRGPFTTPFSGLSAHLPGTAGCRVDCDATYRVFVADALPFHADLQFGIEHGPVNDVPAEYGSTTFWYGRDDPALRRTDRLDVGEEQSEDAHDYEGDGRLYHLEAAYPGPRDDELVIDGVREGTGELRFEVALDPDNAGVLLRRRADQLLQGQAARVLVDGVPAGIWYQASGNPVHRWADDDLLIPARLTRDRESIEVTLQPLAQAPPWTAARYGAYSLLAPDGGRPGDT